MGSLDNGAKILVKPNIAPQQSPEVTFLFGVLFKSRSRCLIRIVRLKTKWLWEPNIKALHGFSIGKQPRFP
jgi:hypothetical protein